MEMLYGMFRRFKKANDDKNVSEMVLVEPINEIEENKLNTVYELMNSLAEWRTDFIELKKELNKELRALDKRELEIKSILNEGATNSEIISAKLVNELVEISTRKKEIIGQKNVIRRIDCDGELTYDMIGKKVNDYKHLERINVNA